MRRLSADKSRCISDGQQPFGFDDVWVCYQGQLGPESVFMGLHCGFFLDREPAERWLAGEHVRPLLMSKPTTV